MKQTVAIIGAGGNVTSEIALGLAARSHRVLLAGEMTRCPHLYVKLSTLKWKVRFALSNADVETVHSAREASWEADIIFLAVPYETKTEVVQKIRDVVTGKTVVNVVDPPNRLGHSVLGDPHVGVQEDLAQLLPYSKIVNALPLVIATECAVPPATPRPRGVVISGNDAGAVLEVEELMKDAGFNPMSAGNSAVGFHQDNSVGQEREQHLRPDSLPSIPQEERRKRR